MENFNFDTPGYFFETYDFIFGINLKYYYILEVSSNNFSSIWADTAAGFDQGIFYITTNKELNIIDLSSKHVTDRYNNTQAGFADELLTGEDIIDMSVSK